MNAILKYKAKTFILILNKIYESKKAMLSFIDFGDTNIIGIRIKGKITEDEFDEVIERFEKKFENHKKVRLYVEIEDFGGMEIKAFFKDLKFGLKNFKRFEREAVVTDRKWAQQFANISDPLVPTVEVKSFPFADRDKAKAWIKE